MNPPKIVAEIGCNHMGDFENARSMIKMAAEFCKADVVKFQKRDNRTLLSAERYNVPHPDPFNSFGTTYGEHRESLEFTIDQHRQLMDCCYEAGTTYSTSVWEEVSARQIIALNPELIKVPSAANLDMAMLSVLADTFGGEIHISLGMTTQREEDRIVSLLERKNRAKDVVLYACTSAYPVDFNDISLLEITRLRTKFEDSVKAVGFSGHHLGIAADVAALTLGAEWFERHFTLNRAWKGTDQAASLEPEGLRRLCRDLHAVHKALSYKKSEILESERPQRAKLKREFK